jgi:hypothetical protein
MFVNKIFGYQFDAWTTCFYYEPQLPYEQVGTEAESANEILRQDK